MAIIERYEAIAEASNAMLKAARAGNWHEVARIEGFCTVLVTELKASQTRNPLNSDEQTRKRELIHGILADDAEIRHLMDPRITHLSMLIKLAGVDYTRSQWS